MSAFWMVFFGLVSLAFIGGALYAYYNDHTHGHPRQARAAAFWAAHWRNGLFVLGIAGGVLLVWLLYHAWPVATLVGLGIIVVLGLLAYTFGTFGRPLGYVLAGVLGIVLLMALACWIVNSWSNWHFNPCGTTIGQPCQSEVVSPPAQTPSPAPVSGAGQKTPVQATNPSECQGYREVANDIANQIAMGNR